jgi:hypothetical protein
MERMADREQSVPHVSAARVIPSPKSVKHFLRDRLPAACSVPLGNEESLHVAATRQAFAVGIEFVFCGRISVGAFALVAQPILAALLRPPSYPPAITPSDANREAS